MNFFFYCTSLTHQHFSPDHATEQRSAAEDPREEDLGGDRGGGGREDRTDSGKSRNARNLRLIGFFSHFCLE